MTRENNKELISAYTLLLTIYQRLKAHESWFNTKLGKDDHLTSLSYYLKDHKTGIGKSVFESIGDILQMETETEAYLKLRLLMKIVDSCIYGMQQGSEV